MAGPPRYIIAHDVGTSSTKAALVEFDGKVKAYSTEPYPVHYPQVTGLNKIRMTTGRPYPKAQRRLSKMPAYLLQISPA